MSSQKTLLFSTVLFSTARAAMQLSGHKTRSVFERYNIVSGGDLREAARRLNTVASTLEG